MNDAATIMKCRSEAQFASLGRVPPRTAGRGDPQTPEDFEAGPARYAFLPHVYFYDAANSDDAAFGFIEISIAVQRQARGKYDLQVYCVGDGHQSGGGLAGPEGLRIEILAGGKVLTRADWKFGKVSAGRCDPMTFRAPIALSDEDIARIDCVRLPAVDATCRID